MDATTTEILSELLTLEQHCLALRFIESTPFVSESATSEMELVEHLADAARQHQADLTEMILKLGGVSEAPLCKDIASADLHYLKLNHLMPRLIAQQEALAGAYTKAVELFGDESSVHSLAVEILGDHRKHLGALRAVKEGGLWADH